MPWRSTSSDMPSTCVRLRIVSSRSAGRHGAMVKPQLPITAVVTPSAGDGRTQGSQVTCASKCVWLSTMPGISARPSGVDRLAGVAGEQRADGGDASAAHAEVGQSRLGAAAVEDERMADQGVEHEALLRGSWRVGRCTAAAPRKTRMRSSSSSSARRSAASRGGWPAAWPMSARSVPSRCDRLPQPIAWSRQSSGSA